ncbi:MAG TPA: hypothetical protein VGV92_06675 [Gammaproteobacteria bacterium]|nr:hypothetical protein [Gammaproteobacteria bacterium]
MTVITGLTAYDALVTAGVVFGFVALMHLLRLFYKVKVVFGKTEIPMWVSVVGFIVPLCLSFWMFNVSIW